MPGMIQITHILREPVQVKALGLHGAPWSISTTEVICARVRSLESALACYEFFHKNSIRISDEALFSLYHRLFRAVPPKNHFSRQNELHVMVKQSLDIKDCASSLSQENTSSPFPLSFLLQTTQQQSTLRPLYHRLNGAISMGNLCKPIPMMNVALSILSTPCAILNMSLYHNLSKGRWNEALRTIHHCQKYDLLTPYVQDLHEARLKYSKSLPLFSNDPYYAVCLRSPSLIPLMNALLIQWEAYWNTLKGVTDAECVLEDILPPLKTPSINVDDENEFEPRPDIVLTDISQRSKLEEKSFDVLSFAAQIHHIGNNDLDNQVEEQEVYHRLTEATTRLADYAFCRRLVVVWSTATSVSGSLKEGTPNIGVPLSETKQLLLTRLLERAPSHDLVLRDLDQSYSCSVLLGPNACLSLTLHCPEVLSVLASRLSPDVFFHEIVEKRLMCSETLLSKCMQEVVRGALEKGELYEAAESFWMRQAHLELALLSESQENCDTENDCEAVLENYLSQIVSTHERVRFLSNLLRGVDRRRCTLFTERICSRTRNQDTLFLLIKVMSTYIKEYHCPGDAAVLLYHITQTKVRDLSTHSSAAIEQEAVASFRDSVAQLGFLFPEQVVDKVGEGESVLQWLKMLSEVPPKLFDEPTLVVWCFWTMRALVQWEEKHNNSTLNNEAITVNVLRAVRNLCLALENCKADAVLPPMLLNWLASRTCMSWAEATGWIARNAGVEASQRRRFLFIRLPLGRAALETFADPQKGKQTLLAVESELRKNALYVYNHYHLSTHHRQQNMNKGGDVQDDFKELYKAIRVNLLRAWYNHATSLPHLPDNTVPCTLNALSLARKRSRASLRMSRGEFIVFSLQEALTNLWKEASPQPYAEFENKCHDS